MHTRMLQQKRMPQSLHGRITPAVLLLPTPYQQSFSCGSEPNTAASGCTPHTKAGQQHCTEANWPGRRPIETPAGVRTPSQQPPSQKCKSTQVTERSRDASSPDNHPAVQSAGASARLFLRLVATARQQWRDAQQLASGCWCTVCSQSLACEQAPQPVAQNQANMRTDIRSPWAGVQNCDLRCSESSAHTSDQRPLVVLDNSTPCRRAFRKPHIAVCVAAEP